MKKSKHSESQIASSLKEYETGRKPEDICRELSFTNAVDPDGRLIVFVNGYRMAAPVLG